MNVFYCTFYLMRDDTYNHLAGLLAGMNLNVMHEKYSKGEA